MPLDGQLAFDLFDKPASTTCEPPNYAQPCPIREWCGAYHCDTGGCTGERGWCGNALNAFVPGKCLCEKKRYRQKSFCAAWDKWTNCREVKHCIYRDVGKSNLSTLERDISDASAENE